MKCPKCGKELKDAVKFCTKCGANIEQELEERVKIETEARAKEEEELKQKTLKEERLREEAARNKEIQKEEQKTVKDNKKDKNFKKNENKPKKKKHKLLKIIIILLLILIVLLGATYGLYKIEKLPDPIKNTVNPVFETIENWLGIKEETKKEGKDKKKETTSNKQVVAIKKIDEEKDLVYDYYTTNIGEKESRIPKINLDCDNIEKVNTQILNLTENEIKEAEKIVTRGRTY